MFVTPNNCSSDTPIAQVCASIDQDLGQHTNEYQFLRGIWSWQKNHQKTGLGRDLDDQMDGLNKIVGMMKQRINHLIKKQVYYQETDIPNEISVIEGKALESMNKAIMKSEEYRSQLVQIEELNNQLRIKNSELMQENHRLRDDLKQINRKVQNLAAEKAELSNRLLSAGFQDAKSARSKRSVSQKKAEQKIELDLIALKTNTNLMTKNILSDREVYSEIKFSRDDQRYSDSQGQDLNISVLSYTAPQILNQKKEDKQNKNSEQMKMKSVISRESYLSPGKNLFAYQKDRNLLKMKSINKTKYEESLDNFGKQSKELTSKFIRQASRKALLKTSERNTEIQKLKV